MGTGWGILIRFERELTSRDKKFSLAVITKEVRGKFKMRDIFSSNNLLILQNIGFLQVDFTNTFSFTM